MEKINTKKWITELGEQLEVSQIRCKSLKSQLGYMQMLYRGVPSDPIDPLKSKDYLKNPSPSLSNSSVKNQTNDFEKFLIREDSHLRSFMDEIHKMNHMIEETIETPKVSQEKIKEISISPKADLEFYKEDEECKKIFDYELNTSPAIILSSRTRENVSCRDRAGKEILKMTVDENSDHQISSPVMKTAREHLIEIPFAIEKDEQEFHDEIKSEELLLKFSQSMENSHVNKKKKANKADKNYKTSGNKTLINKKSNEKMENNIITITKVKRKKGNLKSFHSKSTIATSFSERKDSKKRKQRSFVQKNIRNSFHPRQNQETKIDQNLNDVVELYQNLAIKSGSLSVVSSKNSRLNSHFQEAFNETSSNKCKKVETRQQNVDKFPISDLIPEEDLTKPLKKNSQNETSFGEDNGVNYLQSYPGSKLYDPMFIRNYEQPTVSSKLKRVQRSYFNRFNFRNIPFVVGTSISPTHNLGLNIQQALSLMKAKQFRTNGIAPMLIRKMSQGIKPITSVLSENGPNIFKNFNDENLKDSTLKCQNTISSASRFPNNQQNCCSSMLQTVSRNTCETLFEEMEENNCGEQEQKHSSKKSLSNNKLMKERKFVTQPENSNSLKERQMELNMGDNCLSNYRTVSNNSKGIKEVLIKLHDEFEEMNTRYEKLQEKADKFKNKSVAKEVEKLEVDLTAKENEINAVVGLYKEVMALKKQMKMMAEKNSFVCISTESSNPCPSISPHIQMSQNGGNFTGNIREPSTGTRLIGLLRQIQLFQKQLKQTS